MTRFQIVGIFNDKILTAGEFNGDGYFENGHGEELCAQFPEVKTEKNYRKIVKDMNNQYFNYPEKLIRNIGEQTNGCDIFDFYTLQKKVDENNIPLYYTVWFSDYLYIINLSDDDKEIIDETGIHITVKPNGWVTINFGNLYEQDDQNAEIKCMNNCEIDKFSWFENVCEDQGWNVNVYESEIELSKYTPAGEDFSFTIEADDDLQRQVEEYANDFNVDEYVKMWITSSANGVPSVRELLEDAEWIDEDLQKLAKALIK